MQLQKKYRDIKKTQRPVSPTTAGQWLVRRNPFNRSINKARVAAYAKVMASGGWDVVSDAIMFDAEGTLINGHHRLSAVVLSGATVWFNVWENVPRESLAHIDSGGARTEAQKIVMLTGERQDVGFKTAVSRYLRTYDSGTNAKPTALEAMEYFKKYEEGYAWATDARKNRGLRKAYYWAPLIYLYEGGLSEPCQLFHMSMLEPYNQGQDSAAAALDRAFNTKQSTGGNHPFMQSLRVFNAAWRFKSDQLCRTLYASTTGYDAFNLDIGRKSKRGDNSCAWQNCANLPDIETHSQCWVHRNFGANTSRHAKPRTTSELLAKRAREEQPVKRAAGRRGKSR
jgi:hypothetical protein